MTDKNEKIIFEQTTMPGYNGNSPYIVFNQFRNQATDTPTKISDLPEGIIKVWYNEDFDGSSTHDNSGKAVIKVYVTLVK